jgi:hypothetical protein
MDGDPSVGETGGISLYLPLPYRVAIIIVLGKRPECHYAWSHDLTRR